MKKALITIFALAGLSGCVYYDYYKGGVRYTQDGEDCIYYAGEYGRNFSGHIDGLDKNKKIVYRNTRCADLYAKDNMDIAPSQDRQVLAPAAKPAPKPCPACVQPQVKPCNACAESVQTCESQKIIRRKYVIVPAM